MDSLSPEALRDLELHANDVRVGIIRSLLAAGSGHAGGSLDMADIFTALYFHLMRHDPTNPELPDRDRLLLSCGHIAPVRYAAMACAGYFPVEELLTLRHFGTRLQGHPERVSLPGLETTSGPLGEGLAQGTGMALGAKMDGSDWRVYVVTSDGEHQCGLHWEAMMTAGKFKLDKYRAFNWEVFECDGHDIAAFVDAVEKAKQVKGKPQVVIAHTVMGKGVSFMEGDYLWHGKPPKKDEAEQALRELSEARELIGAGR